MQTGIILSWALFLIGCGAAMGLSVGLWLGKKGAKQ